MFLLGGIPILDEVWLHYEKTDKPTILSIKIYTIHHLSNPVCVYIFWHGLEIVVDKKIQ